MPQATGTGSGSPVPPTPSWAARPTLTRNVVSGNTIDGIVLYENTVDTARRGQLRRDGRHGYNGGRQRPDRHLASRLARRHVGGATSEHGNVVAANVRHGILVEDTGTTIQRNIVGLDRTRTTPLGNLRYGIWLSEAVDSLVSTNAISASGWAGIRISGNAADGNRLRLNTVTGSGRLGIDLHNEGVTTNDAGDTDDGANGIQNFPVVTQLARTAPGLRITGTLDALPGNYVIDAFRSDELRPVQPRRGRRLPRTAPAAPATGASRGSS